MIKVFSALPPETTLSESVNLMVDSLKNFANGANITDGKLDFDNYLNVSKIGSGGYGEIYLYILKSRVNDGAENKFSLNKLIREGDHNPINAVTGQSVPLAGRHSVNKGVNPERKSRARGAQAILNRAILNQTS